MKTHFLIRLRLAGQHNDISWSAVFTTFLEIAVDVYSNNNNNNTTTTTTNDDNNKSILKVPFCHFVKT